MHARALVDARPYTDIGFIHSRFTTLVAPVAEPPALPAAIALLFATVGESIAWVRGLLVASLILFALAAWRFWQRLHGAAVAFVVVAWTLVALTRLHVVDTVLADIPFAAALWGVFAVADASRGVLRPRHFAALAILGALAFGFRMAALPLIPAVVVAVFVRPAPERGGWSLVALVWILSALSVLYLLPGADALGSEVSRSAGDVLRDVRLNFAAMLEGARQWVPLALPWRAANIVLHGALLLIAALGAAVALRAHPRRFAYLTAVWYLLMLVALPTRAARYFWPLYPFLTYAFIRGAHWLLDRAGIALGERAAPLGAAAAGVVLAAGLLQDARSPAPRTLRAEPDAVQLLDALRGEARSGDVRVAVFSPRVITWETGVTTTAFGSGDAAQIFAEVMRARLTHVVVGDAAAATPGTDATARMVSANAASFAPVFRNASFIVHRVRAAGDSAPDRAAR